jgi:pimeloyl-ACP methyl ester carboxylesterase
MAPDRVKHLVLYEPPTVNYVGFAEVFETMAPSDAVEAFSRVITATAEEVGELKATPVWPYLVSFAATMPSEARALVSYGFDPSRYASLKMPALFLAGSRSVEMLVEPMRQLQIVMPQAEWVTFEGAGHVAMMTAPKLFSDTVLAFLAR